MDQIASSPLTDRVLIRILDDQQRLVAENARMKIALESIQVYADRAIFGSWKTVIHNLAVRGLLRG